MYRYNENLTDLQKEFILARKEIRRHIISKCILVFTVILVLVGIGFASWFINNHIVLSTPGNWVGWKYIVTYIAILAVIACIVGIIYGIRNFVIFWKHQNKLNKLDFKVRGILSSEEYKFFIRNSYEIHNFNRKNAIKSKLDLDSFNKNYNRASMYVRILLKLHNSKITPEDLHLFKNIDEPLCSYYVGLNNYDKVCETFNKITELKNNGDYKFYFKNWEFHQITY